MKKTGIILLMLIIWLGAQAEVKLSITTDTAKTEISNDSLKKLYMNEDLDPREATLLQKLTPDQIMQLEQQRLLNERTSDMPFNKLGLTLISLAPFLMVILIVYFANRSKNEREKLRYDLYLKSLESGQPLPEKFFDEPVKKKSSSLKKGAIWLAVGLAIVIGFIISHKENALFLGIIPAFVGAAYLLVYFLEDKKNKAGINE